MTSILRRLFAFFAPVLVAVLATTCAEAPTGSRSAGSKRASLSLTTAFTPAATRAAALIHAAGLDVDKVRVLIVAPATDTLKDTTIAFVADQEQTLDLDIHADPGTTLTAIVNFMAGNTLLYSGSGAVVAYAIGTPADAIPAATISVVPVAPGIAATRLTIPAAGPSPVSTPVTLVAHAFTAAGTEIAGAIFGWSVDDPTIATVNAAGVVQPTAKSGTVNVTAVTLSGASATTGIMFYGPAVRIVTISGDAQSAEAGTAIAQPFVVQVQSATGGPVPNQTVAFGASNGSSVTPTSAVTDVNGRAQTAPTLGTTVGTYGFSATTGSFSAPISATATAGAAASVAVVSGDAQSDTILKTLAKPLAAKVSDKFGNAKAGITVNWARTAGAGSVGAAASTTDATGQTSISYTLGAAAGAETISATVAGVTSGATFSATALAKPATIAVQSGADQSAVAGKTLPAQIVARVLDTQGNPSPNVTVTFAVATGGGSVTPTTATTDANGLAKTTWTLGATVGAQTMTASAAGLSGLPVTVSATATTAPPVALQFVQQPSAIAAGVTMTPAVTVRAVDADGNAVSSFAGTVTIALGANPGSGTLAGTLARTAAGGIATFNDLSVNNVANGYTLQASSTGLTAVVSAAFNVIIPPTARIEWTNTSGGSWSQPSNWNLNRVPATTDSVVIAAAGTYIVNLDTTFVGSVIVVGGAGSGAQTLSLVSRALVVSTSLDIKAGGVFRMSQAGVAGGGTVTNAGTILVPNAASITTPFVNAAGGLLRIASDGSVGTAGLTIPNGFTNNGTFELSSTVSGYNAALVTSTQGVVINGTQGVINALPGTGGSRSIDAQLNNNGTINVDAPLTLTHASAAITTHDNGGTINIHGGNFTVQQTGSSPRFSNFGTVTVNQGFTWAITGGVFFQQATLSGAGSMSLTNASAAFNAPYALPALSLSNTTAQFSSDLSTATTALSMTNSTFNGPGRLINAAGVTTAVKGSNFGANSELVNQGTLIANANNAAFGPFTSAAGSTLRIQSDGSVGTATFTANGQDVTNDGTIELSSSVSGYNSVLAVTGTLTNSSTGAINAVAGTGGTRTIQATVVNQGAITVNASLAIDRASAAHSNTGTITLATADLTINQTGTAPSFTNSGTINVPSGRTLIVSAGTFNEAASATLSGAGTLAVSTAVANYDSPTFALGGLSLTNTTATFQANLSSATTAIGLNGVTFNGPGTITNAATETLTMKNSTIDQSSALINQGIVIANANNTINGPLTAAAGSGLEIQSDGSVGSANLTVANGFTNDGTIDLTSTISGYASSITLGTGSLTNSSTGVINAAAGTGGARTIAATLVNQSGGRVNVAAPLTLTRAGVTHVNAGTINVQSADLTVANGNSTGRLTNTGTIVVSAGRTLVITDGNFDQFGPLSGGGSLATTNLNANFSTLPTLAGMSLNSTTAIFQQSFSTATTSLSLDNGSVVVGPGTITNAGGKTLAMKNSTIASSSALTNQGTLMAIANNTISGGLSTAGGSTIRIQSDGSVGSANLTVANGFANAGTIDLTSTVSGYASSLTVTTGELLNGTGATILASAGTGGARTLAAQLNNQSTITLNAPLTIARASATSSNFGMIDATNGDLTVSQTGTSPTFMNVGTIKVGPTHSWTVNGGAVTQQGTVNGGGTWTINAPTATILNPFTLGAVNFIGTTVDFAPSNFNTTGLALSLDAGTTISGNGSISNVAGQTMTMKNSTINLAFSNAGRLNAIANNTIAGYTDAGSGTVSVYSDGSVPAAQLNFGRDTRINGTMELTSTVSGYSSAVSTIGTLTNAGTISVLTGTGGARTIGTTTGFANSGAINLAIGGTTANSQYTRLDFAGTAAVTLNGTLNVAYQSGFTAQQGNAFTLLTYPAGGTTFSFSTINLPGGTAVWTPTVGAASYMITHQ